MPAKKSTPAKPSTKKVVKPAKPASAVAQASPASKVKKPKAPKKAAAVSPLYLDKATYKSNVDGLMGQGLDHQDAVETLRVGLRQANGRPLPPGLVAAGPVNSDQMLQAA